MSNFLNASKPLPLNLPLSVMNLTVNEKFTKIENNKTILDDITSIKSELPNVNTDNILYDRLGYGDLSDVNTQMMICLISAGTLMVLAIGYLFVRQIPLILQNTPSKFKSRTIMLCGIYSITASSALVSLVVYRSAVFCDSVSHFAFVMCAYQYFTLIIDYSHGESEFIKQTSGLRIFNIQTPPCCCCFPCLLPWELTKNKFNVVRIMVLQMSIVQGTILFLLNIFNLIDPNLYVQLQPFIVPFIVASILTGIWGLQICSRMIAKYLPDHKIMPKYFAIQLVLVCYKLQPAILQLVAFIIKSITEYRIQSKIIENAAIQLLIIFETVILAFFANYVYSVPKE